MGPSSEVSSCGFTDPASLAREIGPKQTARRKAINPACRMQIKAINLAARRIKDIKCSL